MSFVVVAETVVEAPPLVVFDVLTDVTSWTAWCTWLHYEGGAVEVGQRLQLRLTPPDGSGYAFRPEVLAVDPPRHFAWVGRTGTAGVFDGEHHFELAPHGKGTHLVNRERYSGILSPLMKHLPQMKGAAAGFAAINAEIKARAEELARAR